MPVPFKEILAKGQGVGARIWLGSIIFRVWDRPYRNFTTDVAEDNRRGHVRSPACSGQENTASRAAWIMLCLVKPCFACIIEVYICVKFL